MINRDRPGLFITRGITTLLLAVAILSGCSSSTELEWHQEESYRWADIESGYFGDTGFKALSASSTNIDFNNRLEESEVENRHYLNGSGVAAGDIDADGHTDLYFTSLTGPNKLYKNLGGMKFEEISVSAGVAHEGFISTGAVFADIDGDKDLDLLVTAMHGVNVLYMNDGQGLFTRNDTSGLGQARGSMTMTLADITGNGFLDLYIVNYQEESLKDLYTTEELEWENILNEPLREPTDIYTLKPPFDQYYELEYVDGQLSGVSEIGEPDELYLNNGGQFEKVENVEDYFLDENGLPFGLPADWGLSAKFQDLNGDSHQDLYVCNDFQTPDRIWINQGNGRFRAIARQAIRSLSFACMGVDFSDINRDGLTDIFTTEMLNPDHQVRMQVGNSSDPRPIQIGDTNTRRLNNKNSLFLQREDETFAEIANLAGVTSTGWSWDATFMDVNLNGYEDIIVSTGYLSRILNVDTQIAMMNEGLDVDEHFTRLLSGSPPLDITNKILINNGDLTFSDQSSDLGFTEADISQGMAVADLNNDGALDIITNRMNRPAGIYENRTRKSRISVRLEGDTPNTFGTGAVIQLIGGPAPQQKQVASGGDYLSGSDPMVMFAASEETDDHQIIVTWPDGRVSQIDGVRGNRIYVIEQSGASSPAEMQTRSTPQTQIPSDSTSSLAGNGSPDEGERNTSSGSAETTPATSAAPVMFADRTGSLNHSHHEELFPDFDIQPLLPFSKSQSGPGITWLDVTGDGMDDLLIASGKGAEMSVLQNLGDNRFEPMSAGPVTQPAPGDQTSILGWRENDLTHLVVGSANLEQPRLDVASAYHYVLDSSGQVVTAESLPGFPSTTGPMAAADVNRDGTIDLFVGGAFIPGQYPRDASSRLFMNREGQFEYDPSTSQLFEEIGLVNGALFADITGNGWQDLLVATGWGTLRLFENTGGQAIRAFREVTSAMGLDTHYGWWQGISTGDFNADGRLDIVAANVGRNSFRQLTNDQPIRMYFTDFDSDSRTDIIEATANENGAYVPRFPLYRYQTMQVSLNRMSSHADFANATIPDILGELYANRIPMKQINRLEHTLFINSENGFTATALPVEAQFSTGFSPVVADFNNDGHEDLFLSQNLFAMPQNQPRTDAGRGLLMLGDGEGGFTPLTGSESGIRVYGEQRGAALGDYNNDGRTDLVVTQNGAETVLYENQSEKTGVRIRLHGPDTNTSGIGSSVRLIYPDGTKGPRRVIQAGSGYWSQNSPVQILGYSEWPEAMEVTWFDGRIQEMDIDEGQTDYRITYD